MSTKIAHGGAGVRLTLEQVARQDQSRAITRTVLRTVHAERRQGHAGDRLMRKAQRALRGLE